MYRIIQVYRRKAEALEPLGTKSKFWFTDTAGQRVLFKAEERGTGEDWAEKVSCELAGLLGLPHVHYDLAHEIESNTPGVVCVMFREPGETLIHGNQLLLAVDSKYPKDDKRFKVKAHTVDAVANVVAILLPTTSRWNEGLPEGIATAMDIFVGYILLDAWIANQDRHHQNWGAILQPEPKLVLAPTFDHGASMARNISDDERRERLTSKDQNRQIEVFAKRARSAFYADPAEKRPLTTVAAWRRFADLAPAAARIWLQRLAGVERAAVAEIMEQIPPQRLSAIGREFTIYLLEENRRRLLDGEAE